MICTMLDVDMDLSRDRELRFRKSLMEEIMEKRWIKCVCEQQLIRACSDFHAHTELPIALVVLGRGICALF